MTNGVILDKRHVNYIQNNLEQVRHIINNHGNCLKKSADYSKAAILNVRVFSITLLIVTYKCIKCSQSHEILLFWLSFQLSCP